MLLMLLDGDFCLRRATVKTYWGEKGRNKYTSTTVDTQTNITDNRTRDASESGRDVEPQTNVTDAFGWRFLLA